MSLGKNLQYLRQLSGNMTQEALAEKLMLVVRQSQNGKAMQLTLRWRRLLNSARYLTVPSTICFGKTWTREAINTQIFVWKKLKDFVMWNIL